MTTADYLESLQNDLNTIKTSLNLEEGTNFSDIATMAGDGEIVKGGGSSGHDWQSLGFGTEPGSITEGYEYAEYIKENYTEGNFKDNYNLIYMPTVVMPGLASFSQWFYNCYCLQAVAPLTTGQPTTLSYMFANCYALKTIPQNLLNMSSVTDVRYMFQYCYSLVSMPQIDTSNVSDFRYMFTNCINLRNIPQLSTARATRLDSMFASCPNLTDASLDNILKMCINVYSSFSRTKTLSSLGISGTAYPASRIQALPSYEAFIEAGWKISQ